MRDGDVHWGTGGGFRADADGCGAAAAARRARRARKGGTGRQVQGTDVWLCMTCKEAAGRRGGRLRGG